MERDMKAYAGHTPFTNIAGDVPGSPMMQVSSPVHARNRDQQFAPGGNLLEELVV